MSRATEPPAERAARDRAARRTTLTGRAAILAAVVAVLGISLAVPLRQTLSQRAEMQRLEETVDRQRQRVGELAAERERWNDPAYIKAQARERLHYCMPKETCYVTVESTPTPTAAPSDGDASGGGSSSAAEATPAPWYADLWQSIEDAAGAEGGATEGPTEGTG